MTDEDSDKGTSPPARFAERISLAWLLLGLAYLLIPLCLLLPMNTAREGSVYSTVLWFVFLARTFFFHAGLVLVLFALVACWRRRWRYVIFCLPVLAATVGPEALSYLPRARPQVSGESFKLMSVNLWRGNQDIRLLNEIVRESPDVVLFQEYTHFWHREAMRKLSQDYPHALHAARDDSFGAAIFSKLPFRDDGESVFFLGQIKTPQMRVEIQLGDRSVAVYNIHLLSPGTPAKARINRRQCAGLLARWSDDEPLPVIAGGDFNFSQYSRQDDWIRRFGLVESHREVGRGRGATWSKRHALRHLPGVRIDHVYYSPEIACRECRRGKGRGSDHLPVIVSDLGWRQK